MSGIDEELGKIRNLVSRGICKSYVLMTNARVTGGSEQAMRKAILDEGVVHPLILGGQWVNQTIAMNQRLRMFVPRVYGLGDLSQILDERAYTQARGLLDYLKEDLSTFVVTDAYRRAAEAVSQHGFCLLLGEPAVGKSVIAATLAMSALDQWHSLTIRADGPEDVVNHWNPNEPNQFFWVDDAFGAVRHERALTEGWARRMAKVMTAVNGGAKVVLTSRDYIYRQARVLLKEYAYPLLHENQVVIDVAKLSRQERQQIVYNHIRRGDQSEHFRSAIKPFLKDVADQTPFRPEVARRLGRRAFTEGMTVNRQTVTDFVAKPNKFLQDVFEGLDPDHIGALAMVYQSGELPAPLEILTNERVELLTLIGSTPQQVNSALASLEDTFLRRAPKIGSTDLQVHWSFRHPTLREGFASFIARDINLLKLFIQGLDDIGIMTQLDCGSGDVRGTLVAVPSNLYHMVANRTMAIHRRIQHLDWYQERVWHDFLATRCSKLFLERYLDVDSQLVDRCIPRGSYLDATGVGISLLARLHEFGLLPEEDRQESLHEIGDLAVETPDADWLDIDELHTLFSGAEYASLLDRVRLELAPRLDDTLWHWEFNEQGDSAEEYYGPLREAFDRYIKVFEAEPNIVNEFRKAISRVDDLESEASHWQNNDGEPPTPKPSPSGRLSAAFKAKGENVGNTRNIFDDVDK
ncbi:MAG TPA: hypothetical protein VFW65_33165 [Pseudonocardiaceae bacterium]|nr:hypothetical protein [Pseudonocardiaceae bacterium]